LWRQIAHHYRDHPPTLYFEILNEPCKELTNDLWNECLGEAISLIRESNPTRPLVVGPTQWNNISQLKHLELPPGDRNLIVSFHYYQPFHFTHQGASWVGEQSSDWLGTEWTATEKERGEVVSRLDQAVRWAEENRVPLHMGEFGAYSKAGMASRARWTAFLRSEAEKRGISWAYWEFCAGFGVYDPVGKTWREELLHALLPNRRMD
jgi:endoglucanase